MRNYILGLCCAFVLIACAEKLIEKPENLIARDKMAIVLKDMAIVHAARTTNITILKENGVEPTQYVFEKHGIDSTIFVDSDRYYAAQPLEYVAIYEEVEALLENQEKEMEELKKIKDSLKILEREMRKEDKDSLKVVKKITTTSPQ